MHSHSGLERELRYPKHKVLVDERYEDWLIDKSLKKSIKFDRKTFNDVTYIEVPIMLFVKNGGVFKNLNE